MGKAVVIGVVLFFVILLGFFLNSNRRETSRDTSLPTNQQPSLTSQQVQSVDRKASFAIFTNGTFRVFTASMYHNLSEDVFIQADNPNVVFIKKSGVTWNDFFKTLPFALTNDCLTTGTKEIFCTNQNGTLKFYLNGVKDDGLLTKEIQEGDKALITYGNESKAQIQKQIERLASVTNTQ